jgi:preprotein translocase subunit YajC
VSPQFLIVIILLFGLLWMFMIRPQKRRQLKQQDMLDKLASGDEILTAGGFYGTVQKIEDDVITVEIAPGTEIRVAKRAVAAVIPAADEDAGSEDLDESEDGEAVHAGAEGDSGSDGRS